MSNVQGQVCSALTTGEMRWARRPSPAAAVLQSAASETNRSSCGCREHGPELREVGLRVVDHGTSHKPVRCLARIRCGKRGAVLLQPHVNGTLNQLDTGAKTTALEHCCSNEDIAAHDLTPQDRGRESPATFRAARYDRYSRLKARLMTPASTPATKASAAISNAIRTVT